MLFRFFDIGAKPEASKFTSGSLALNCFVIVVINNHCGTNTHISSSGIPLSKLCSISRPISSTKYPLSMVLVFNSSCISSKLLAMPPKDA